LVEEDFDVELDALAELDLCRSFGSDLDNSLDEDFLERSLVEDFSDACEAVLSLVTTGRDSLEVEDERSL